MTWVGLGFFLLFNFCNQADKQSQFQFIIQGDSLHLFFKLCNDEPALIELYGMVNGKPQALAKDTNADGTLDWIADPGFSPDSLKNIYQTGLLMNDKCRLSKDYVYSKNFFMQDSQYLYTMQTIIPVNGKISNRLVIQSRKDKQKTIALDINADGVLESVLNTDSVSNYIQNSYKQVLEAGLEKDVITRNYDMLFVEYD